VKARFEENLEYNRMKKLVWQKNPKAASARAVSDFAGLA